MKKQNFTNVNVFKITKSKNKMIFNRFAILTLLLCIYIFTCAYFYVIQVSSDLQDNIFRLHVIANSDSVEDQNLKYIVRDNLIEYMNTICNDCETKEDAILTVNNHLGEFTEIANQTIANNGFTYNATVELGNFEFPTKTYADISFPAGYYDALKVKLGDSKGQNWWCVLYPALCFVDTSSGFVPDESKYMLKENLSDEEYELISDDKTLEVSFKFKLLEFFTQNHILSAKK